MKLSIIVAVSENNVIGKNNDIPWKQKDDLKRFAQLTRGHLVIVGRKTHESILKRIGHPLRDRIMLVISRSGYDHENDPSIKNVRLWPDALQWANENSNKESEVFIIGGAELYQTALPDVDRIYFTFVHTTIPDGNAFFPKLSLDWEFGEAERYPANSDNEFDFSFVIAERKPQFVVLDHAREEDQYQVMKNIIRAGECPFCPNNLTKYHRGKIRYQGHHWLLTDNQWPYPNTAYHLLLITCQHTERITELSCEAWSELLEIIKWIERKYNFRDGSLGIRFGDPAVTAATVRHLHAHLVKPKITNKEDPHYQPVRFKMG